MSVPFTLPERRDGVVALMSGGLDSAVMASLALAAGERLRPLYVRQGFVWETEELAVLESFISSLGERFEGRLGPLCTATLDAPAGYASRWATSRGERVPDERSADEAVYLPGRNLALLTQASILAYSEGLTRIQIGVLSGNPFPDATEGFFSAFEAVVLESMGWPLVVERPLAAMNKTEALGRAAACDLGRTLSCIRPRGGAHCGRCNKCAERRKAFAEAGIADPAPYAEPLMKPDP